MRTAGASALLDLVSDLSSRFAHVAPEKTDREVRSALKRILALFDLDRCALYGVDPHSGSFKVLHWVDRARTRTAPDVSDARERYPWVFDRVVGRGKTLSIESLDELPVVATTDKESFRRRGTRSALVIPMVAAGTVDHVLTFASTRRRRKWSEVQTRHLRLLGETFVGALRRKTLDDAHIEARQFEELIADLSSGFAGVTWDHIDEQIDVALNQLLAFTRADQCAFFTVFPERGEGRMSYLASHDVTVPVGTTTRWASVTPWLFEKIVKRVETAYFSQRDDLPPEASADKRHLEARRAQAAVFVPYPVDGETRYLLAVVANDAKRDWPVHFVERLKVLGTVFINALNRKAIVGAQMQAQTRLRTAQRFAQAELDALNEYVGVMDATGTLVETSGKWSTLDEGNGDSPEGVTVGGNYLLACESTQGSHRDATTQLAQGIRNVLRGDAERFTMESARLSASGLRWIHSRVRRFVVEGEIYAAIAHEDITARRKTEQELQDLRAQHWHSERITQTGVLIASIAHEISQPLTAILSNAQAGLRFIARDALDPQEMREILSDIVSDDKRAAEIIESLRIMLRRQRTEREMIDVADIVRDVVALLHSELIRKQVDMERACAPDCVVLANRAQIQQVVLNLVINGIDAMMQLPPNRRHLRITLGRVDGKVRIGVRDAGIGILPEDLEKVFDAFWTTKSNGTGMGLTVCQSIIESHGGRIWGERNDDAGSTFHVELPSTVGREQGAPADAASIVAKAA